MLIVLRPSAEPTSFSWSRMEGLLNTAPMRNFWLKTECMHRSTKSSPDGLRTGNKYLAKQQPTACPEQRKKTWCYLAAIDEKDYPTTCNWNPGLSRVVVRPESGTRGTISPG